MNFNIEIDGSIGGGSVLRVAVPLALGLNKSIKITNIRSKRRNPGLRTQHLLGLKYLADISNYIIIGATIGSQVVTLTPNEESKKIVKSKIKIDTAASVSLIIQALCNYSFVSKKDVEFEFIGGGTHTNWSPNFDYVQEITKSVFQLFGLDLNVKMRSRGFYPKGGASGMIKISCLEIDEPINLVKSDITHVKLILCASSNLKQAKVLERQKNQISKAHTGNHTVNFDSAIDYEDTRSTGTSATLVIYYDSHIHKGISILGEKGVSSEEIADKLFKQYQICTKEEASVDQFMADQIILPLALSKIGSSATLPKLTDHVEVNINIVNKILGNRISLEYTKEYVKLTRI